MARNFSIRLSDALRASLEERAKRNHRNLGQEISYLVEQALRFERCDEAKELSALFTGCPACKPIEALTEAQP